MNHLMYPPECRGKTDATCGIPQTHLSYLWRALTLVLILHYILIPGYSFNYQSNKQTVTLVICRAVINPVKIDTETLTGISEAGCVVYLCKWISNALLSRPVQESVFVVQ